MQRRIHRASAIACELSQVVGSCGGGPDGSCATDADCTDAAFGFCNAEPLSGFCSCSYGCHSDAACAADEACLCAGETTNCVQAHCTTDADCGDYLCAFARDTLACHTPNDTCRVKDDCAGDSCPSCAYDAGSSAWRCDAEFGTCDA